MSDTKAEQVAAGEERLDAVYLADGRYAYRAEETDNWYVGDAADVADLGRMLLDGVAEAYSQWCAGSTMDLVEADDHDLLDAICDAGGNAERDYACQCGTAQGQACEWSGHRDDLVHVRWVPESNRGSADASGTGTSGPYARHLYVSSECARALSHIWVDGEETDDLDCYVRVVGPAYA